jgi:GT2 family glycosyltransferase
MSAFNPLDHPICFAYPLRLASSGWTGHVPFGMYLIDVLRPKVLVELGLHNGVSYCSFCQAVKELKIETRCYAIHNREDEQLRFYTPEVLADLKEDHDPLYGGFSRIVQSKFDEAVAHFENGIIDLLHLNGSHTYAAVKHDFETWLPKMSKRGVVLLHDTNVREGDFGVWKFWKELERQYPHFEFVHSRGLGLLAVGEQSPELLQELLNISKEHQAQIREIFYQLGARLNVTHELQTLKRTTREQSGASIRLQQSTQGQLRQSEDSVDQRAANEAPRARQLDELSEVQAPYDKQINEICNPHPVNETQPAQLAEETNDVRAESKLKHQADKFSQERSTYRAQLIRVKEYYENQNDLIRARDESLASIQAELAKSEEKVALLSAQLSAKACEVDQMTRSFGWRLLSRYGRLKYRYLLPVYRMLGLRRVNEDGRTAQLPPEDQTAPITQLPILQSVHSAQELSEQGQLSPADEILAQAPAQLTRTVAISSDIAELSQQMEHAVAEFQKRMDTDPSILDWNSGLELAVSFPHLAVFSPLSCGSRLPYLDHSIDIVVTSSPDPGQIAEARRVAAVAVIRSNTLFTELEHLTPRKVAKPLVSLLIEWLTDHCSAPSMPSTSIIIPVFNKVSYTQSCLEQLIVTLPQDFNGEIIVVDDASSDETLALLERWADMDRRIKILRNPENVGFVTSCNRGAESAQGDILVFLNNDTLPLSGWLPPLLRILRDKPEAGAVGGKLVYPDGTLQEAGGVIFSDGSGCNFGWSDKAANAPLYNFVREVDYCSGALLATPRALFRELGGFDARFKPAYYEDVDYCFTLREKGYRVYYQPESVIVHFEGASSGTDLKTGMKSYQVVNQHKFVAKWSEALKKHYPAPDQYDPFTLNTLSRRNGWANGDGN